MLIAVFSVQKDGCECFVSDIFDVHEKILSEKNHQP